MPWIPLTICLHHGLRFSRHRCRSQLRHVCLFTAVFAKCCHWSSTAGLPIVLMVFLVSFWYISGTNSTFSESICCLSLAKCPTFLAGVIDFYNVHNHALFLMSSFLTYRNLNMSSMRLSIARWLLGVCSPLLEWCITFQSHMLRLVAHLLWRDLLLLLGAYFCVLEYVNFILPKADPCDPAHFLSAFISLPIRMVFPKYTYFSTLDDCSTELYFIVREIFVLRSFFSGMNFKANFKRLSSHFFSRLLQSIWLRCNQHDFIRK